MARHGKWILIVDDDKALRQSLSEQLTLHEEFEITAAECGTDALEIGKADHFDLIILDEGLPDIDGRDVCRLLRRGGVRAPIVMLTDTSDEAHTILGLDSGANDLMVKPFKLGVLLACIRAQLRQHERSEYAVFAIGPYTFRPDAKMLVDSETKKKIRLTEKEAATLKFLFRAGQSVIGRDVLLNEVWGYSSGVATHTLETHVYRLRQKIERDPSNAEILVTEAGGYRLVP